MKEIEKKTKIVCTIGPASEDEVTLKKMIQAGMDVMRLNFSHGTHEEHAKKIETLRRISNQIQQPVAIMLDTKGPEIRTHEFVGGQTTFYEGQVVRIKADEIEGTSDCFSITYHNLYQDVKQGGFILLNDGQITLQVDHVEGTDILCVCGNDGVVCHCCLSDTGKVRFVRCCNYRVDFAGDGNRSRTYFQAELKGSISD